MRIVVTGASGNLGSALVRRLVVPGSGVDEVTGVSRRDPGPPVVAGHGATTVTWQACDLGSPGAVAELTRAFAGCDAVVHLAWKLQPGRDLEELRRTNVTGSRNVVTAAVAAGVPHLVAITSVGAYSAGPKDAHSPETWPTQGIPTSTYSRQKVEVERLLDDAERDHPAMVVSRVRPALVFQGTAATEIAAIFLGPLVPRSVLGRVRLPVLPLPRRLTFQGVHADDVATAVAAVVRARAAGAFNVAADPALTPDDLARAVGARRSVPVPLVVLRALAVLTFRAHLQPTEPGWLDLAAHVPLMSTDRIRALGWTPEHPPTDALEELVTGMRTGRTDAGNPPLSGGRGSFG